MGAKRFSLEGKGALVTGASSGLGAYFARVLAEEGAKVALTARRFDNLERVAAEINAAGGTAIPIQCDVTDADQVAASMEQAWSEFGRLDVVVNNAGTVTDGASMPEKLDNDIFNEVIAVNLTGVWYCCREAGRRMLADGRGGSIINISSIMGLGGASDHPVAYQTTKGAVNNMTRNLACSWADRGVRVNAICPGYFPSEMTDPFFAVDGYLDYVNAATAMGRVGDLEELAGPLLLLASDAGSYITGHMMVVDGGYSASIGGVKFDDRTYRGMSELFPDGRAEKITADRGSN
jgi:NAD(P)-dependent dehydrogenase (short-subunit alcohol dehydrogenase family)